MMKIEAELNKRIDLLLMSGLIEQNEFDKIRGMVDVLQEGFGLELTEDFGGMFVTHMAMVFSRLRKSEQIAAADEILLAEILAQPNIDEIRRAEAALENVFSGAFPEYERGFILIHIANLLRNA